MSVDLLVRCDCVSETWTPRQRLHPGNVAWSHCGGDGTPPPAVSLAWGSPLVGFADVWTDASGDGPAEVSLHVSPRAGPEQRSRIVGELLAGLPSVTLEVSRQDGALVETLAAAGLREVAGPWFAQLWRDLRDTSDLERHTPPPGYRIRGVDVTDADEVSARVEVHRRAWAPARIKRLMGLAVTGEERGSSYSIEKHRDVIATPAYRAELDLVVVDPAGAVVAYALGWLDEGSRSLLFEPVGTDPAHSGRGLGRAVCATMLRTARLLGAEGAVVSPRGDPGYPLPRRLYEGLSMREVARFVPMASAAG